MGAISILRLSIVLKCERKRSSAPIGSNVSLVSITLFRNKVIQPASNY